MLGTGSVVAILILVVRVVLLVMRMTDRGEVGPEARSWNEPAPPKPRSRREVTDTVTRRAQPSGAPTAVTVRGAWAFGAGPTFTLMRNVGARKAATGVVQSFVGAEDAYVITSKGAGVVPRLFSAAILDALDELPRSAVVRATRDAIELTMEDALIDERTTKRARKVVLGLAKYGVDVMRARVQAIEGAKLVQPEDMAPTHAQIPTRAGLANLDFDLDDEGLTATLVLETKRTESYYAAIDAAGSITSGERAWLTSVPVQSRKNVGPATVTIEDGWVEIAWKHVPTAEHLTQALDLLAIVATSAGPAYR